MLCRNNFKLTIKCLSSRADQFKNGWKENIMFNALKLWLKVSETLSLAVSIIECKAFESELNMTYSVKELNTFLKL